MAGLGKSTGKVILSPKEHHVPENHSLNPSRLPSSPVCGAQAIHLGVMKGVSAIVGVCQLKDLTAAGEEPGVSKRRHSKSSLATWPMHAWASHSTSMSLSFVTCQVGFREATS